MKSPSRAVVTLALGPQVYFDLATNLARSFAHWNTGAGIRFCIITDKPVTLPPDLAEVETIVVAPGRYGTGFSPKLWLDQLVPADQNLFIDSDCLCFGPLAPVFDRLAGQAVTVIGEARTEGHFFGNIPALRATLDLPWMASFVGCVYFVERSPAATAVYTDARRFEADYDRLGLIRLRDVPNEEPLMGLALGRHRLKPYPDDGTIKADAMYYSEVRLMNVLTGEIFVAGPVLADSNRHVIPTARPVVFHFNSHYTEGRFYRRECVRLELIRRHGWPVWAAALWSNLGHYWPASLYEKAKDLFRPAFHRLFGAREVRSGPR